MGVYGRHFRAHPAHNGATFRPDLRVRLTGFCLKEKSEDKFLQEKTFQSHSGIWPESGSIVSWMGPKLATVYPHCELIRAKMETRKAVRQPGARFWSSGASIRSLWSSRRDQSWAGLGLGSYPLAAPQGPAGADLRRPNQAPSWAMFTPGG